MSSVHPHYLVVLGVECNRSKPPLLGIFSVPGTKVVTASLSSKKKEKKAFDHLQSQDGMHYSLPHTHSLLHQAAGLLIKRFAICESLLRAPWGNG